MGNKLCLPEQPQPQLPSPSLIEPPNMIPIQPQLSQPNQKSTKIPSPTYAKKCTQRPSLFEAVEQAREKSILLRGFKQRKHRGVGLSVYYVYRYRGYYEGEWNQGLPHGAGKIYFTDGSYFEGEFENGQIIGEDNLYIYPDGSYRRGSIIDGNLQGYGIFVSQDGKFMYEGQWKNNKPHGTGKETFPDGSKYEGKFVQGKKEDIQGTYTWKNGKVYTGQMKNGYMQGQGKLYLPNGMGQYIGQFSKNLIVGHGRMKTETGVYQGTFQNGLMQGKGRFNWYDGKIYDGQFYQGQMHGKGKMVYPNGQVVFGEWHYGENLKVDLMRER